GICAFSLPHLGIDPSKVEQPPPQTCHSTRLKTSLSKKTPWPNGRIAKETSERDFRVILGKRLPDARIRRGDPSLGSDNVAATSKEFGRIIQYRDRRNGGDIGRHA